MDADLDTLATALYVKIDELLKAAPQLAPAASGRDHAQADRRRAGLPGGAVALLGFCSEARWLRYADRHLRHLFPYQPKQPGYNKRLRAAADLLVAGHRGAGRRHQLVDR